MPLGSDVGQHMLTGTKTAAMLAFCPSVHVHVRRTACMTQVRSVPPTQEPSAFALAVNIYAGNGHRPGSRSPLNSAATAAEITHAFPVKPPAKIQQPHELVRCWPHN